MERGLGGGAPRSKSSAKMGWVEGSGGIVDRARVRFKVGVGVRVGFMDGVRVVMVALGMRLG